MSTLRTTLLAVVVAGGMSAVAFAEDRDGARSSKPYTLTLDALVGPSRTDVVLQISATGGQALPAEAEHVLLWSTPSRGRLPWTRLFKDVPLVNGRGVIEGLPIPAHLQLSALVMVRVGNSHAVQMLSASTVALDRPDLRIARVDAPAEVHVGQFANIEVVVQEGRGYRGATFNVELLEGDAVIDRVSGATIDPMGLTAAVFAVRFESAGAHALTARIVDAVPGEYDLSNNSASFQILATDLSPVKYSLSYRRFEGEFSDNFTSTSTVSQSGKGPSELRITEHTSLYQEAGRQESLNYSSNSNRFVSGLIDFTATIRVDGNSKVAYAITGWAPFRSSSGPDFSSTSYQAYDPETDAHVYVESNSGPKGSFTVVTYSRAAGDYTYHSSGYDSFWSSVSVTDPVTGEVVTTIEQNESSTEASGTVLSGVFLDAFQKIQLDTILLYADGTMGGRTQEHEVLMSTVDRSWDETSERPGQTNHVWGYERRTYWDAVGGGATTP